ncbi:acyl-CoA N-acyltransferase [Obba rivulosa]|uniref:Acyl-CoA N-acyltransferase n=1 Tax=Obba rivulosa TaxID=1052685 RepID=A0A8E2DNM7_9APHY|nr:acyl-CoA N-acyltransferase [Obba rivulosa]
MPAQNAYVRRLVNPSEEELQAAVEVLRAAFYNDTGMASLSEGSKRLENLIYRLTMNAALAHGEFHVAVVDGQIQGIALFIGPDYDWVFYEQPEFASQLSQYGQEWYAHHYAPTYEELYRSAFSDSRQSRRDAWNLAFLGIHPRFQSQGLGRSLLAAVMNKADADNRRIIANVKNPHTVQFFRKLGFSHRSVKNLTSKDFTGFPLWCMAREPTRPRSA